MTEIITLGSAPDGVGGDSVKTAFDKVNSNFNVVDTSLDNKVDKEIGKGLSETNYTQAEKTKLAGVADEATKNRDDSENADKLHMHTADQVSGLGYAATAPTVGDGDEVLRSGAYGVGGVMLPTTSYPYTTTQVGFSNFAETSDPELPMYGMSVVFGGKLSPDPSEKWLGQLFSSVSEVPDLGFRTYSGGQDWNAPVTLYHSANLLDIGTTATTARSALGIAEVIANIHSVPKSASYTVTAADKGASIDTSAGVTIPASVFTVGDVIVVTNTGASSISITPDSGVTLRLAGTASTGARTLAGYGVATFRMASSNVWFASGAGLS